MDDLGVPRFRKPPYTEHSSFCFIHPLISNHYWISPGEHVNFRMQVIDCHSKRNIASAIQPHHKTMEVGNVVKIVSSKYLIELPYFSCQLWLVLWCLSCFTPVGESSTILPETGEILRPIPVVCYWGFTTVPSRQQAATWSAYTYGVYRYSVYIYIYIYMLGVFAQLLVVLVHKHCRLVRRNGNTAQYICLYIYICIINYIYSYIIYIYSANKME